MAVIRLTDTEPRSQERFSDGQQHFQNKRQFHTGHLFFILISSLLDPESKTDQTKTKESKLLCSHQEWDLVLPAGRILAITKICSN